MTKTLFSPVAGMIQDIILLSAGVLIFLAVAMLLSLRLVDFLSSRKRRKEVMGRAGLRVIQ